MPPPARSPQSCRTLSGTPACPSYCTAPPTRACSVPRSSAWSSARRRDPQAPSSARSAARATPPARSRRSTSAKAADTAARHCGSEGRWAPGPRPARPHHPERASRRLPQSAVQPPALGPRPQGPRPPRPRPHPGLAPPTPPSPGGSASALDAPPTRAHPADRLRSTKRRPPRGVRLCPCRPAPPAPPPAPAGFADPALPALQHPAVVALRWPGFRGLASHPIPLA